MKEAVRVLDEMNPATGYPKMLGYNLARDLLTDRNATLPRCRNIYRSISDEQQRARICEKSLDMHFVLKVAELVEQMEQFRKNGHQGDLKAFEDLLDLKVETTYFKTVLNIIEPVLPCKYLFSIHS